MSTTTKADADGMGAECVVDKRGAEEVRAELGMAGLDLRELEQPLVFYRVGWDFRWLSRSSIVARLQGRARSSGTGNEVSAAHEEPQELTEFVDALRGLLKGDSEEHGKRALLDVPREVLLTLSGSLRDVVVMPGGWHRDDTWLALRCVLTMKAAAVLPPEEGAFAWTALWSRPTVLVAAADQLAALDAELGEARPRKGKRALARVRTVVAVGSGTVRSNYELLAVALPSGCHWISAEVA